MVIRVPLDGLDVSAVTDFSIAHAGQWFLGLNDKLNQKQQDIAYRILKEINERLGFLNSVGLEYLTLSRMASTLSGGEAQRIQLATSLGSRLVGLVFVGAAELQERRVEAQPADGIDDIGRPGAVPAEQASQDPERRQGAGGRSCTARL